MILTTHIKFVALVIGIFSIHGSMAITFSDVERTVDTLQAWYNTIYGLWVPSSDWWNSANCLTTLANLAAIDDGIKDRLQDLWQDVFTKAPRYNNLTTQRMGSLWRRELPKERNLSLLSRGSRRRSSQDVGFINGYYDDEGWWALAWIAVYDLTQDSKYLNEAITIFNDMNAAYNTTPLGGLWWDKSNTYVNSIANELYFSVAAHLATRCPSNKSYYVDLAENSWNWLYNSGLINNRNNFIDGLNISQRTSNMDIVWSYNQGVILGALTEPSAATSQPLYLSLAHTIAIAALKNLTSITHPTSPDLILHDPCEPTCGPVGSQFKGIFARNLATLQSTSPTDLYAEFLMKNAEAVWQNRNGTGNALGQVWGAGGSVERDEDGDASAQCSGIDVLAGALAVLGEWEGNGTVVVGRAVEGLGESGGGEGWDTVSWRGSGSGK